MVRTADHINGLALAISANSNEKGFWEGHDEAYEIPRKLALVHAEVSEALEEHRANGETKAFGEELADIVIRVLDLAGYYGIAVGDIIVEKHMKNKTRPHKHGKRY